ncbi:hypothetical protein GCM10010415_76050 [Streptomyces atrovirens]
MTLRSIGSVTCMCRARIRAAPPGLPSRDRVDHDIWDAEDQEDGRGGVTRVTKVTVPDAGVPK